MSAETRVPDTQLDLRGVLAAVWLKRWRIVVFTLFALMLTYGVLSFLPRMYESSASVLVEPRDNIFTRVAGDVPQAQGPSADVAVSSQIELIKSRDTILSVIESEGLRDVPEFNGARKSIVGLAMSLIGRGDSINSPDEEILSKVASQLTVIRQRDSQVVTIFFRSQDPVVAAQVANAIARTHLNRRSSQALEDTAEATRWLENEIEGLRVRVAEAEARVATYKIENDLFTGDNNISLFDQQLSDIASQITATQERKNSAASRSNLIRGLVDAGQPIGGVQDVRESVVVQQLSQQKAQLQADRAQKLASLLPSHPDVKALAAQIAELEKQILEEGRRVADALEAEARIEGALEDQLREDLVAAKAAASMATRETVPLNELQREATAQRELLETYLKRFREAGARTNTSSVLPDVRIISGAAPSVTPASPKVGLTMAAVGVIVFSLQVGGILFGELLGGQYIAQAGVKRGKQADGPPQKTTGEWADTFGDAPAFVGPLTRRGAATSFHGGAGRETEPEIYEAGEQEDQFHDSEPVPEPSDGAEWAEDNTLETENGETGIDEAGYEDYAARQPVPVFEDVPKKGPAEPGAGSGIDGLPGIDPMAGAKAIRALSTDIAAGREQVILLVTPDGHRDSHALADILIEDALSRGVSAALVDASSRHPESYPGLTDLCAGEADFGDVVQRPNPEEEFAVVGWGTKPVLDTESPQANTLISALSELYRFVLVQAGRVDKNTALPLFANLSAKIIIASSDPEARARYASLERELMDIGFTRVQFLPLPGRRAKIA